MNRIAYTSGYKYQLQANYSIRVFIFPPKSIRTKFILLDVNGLLLIKSGYAWDGPSGPTIDTKTFMRGSLVHDALYQLMREGHLDPSVYRETADQVLYDLCREDGMNFIRAWIVFKGVRMFGDHSACPSGKHPTLYAPRPD